ncbi:MAG TPA: T9SS type A sorting domain-containing protein [Flavobacterium sp.]|jgi:hypothetical protein
MIKALKICVVLFSLGAAAQTVEVRLVDATVGHAFYNGMNTNAVSNDNGLNAILANHNVYSYVLKAAHPYPALQDRIMEASCDCNAAAFIADLEAYALVVASAQSSSYGFFNDALTTKIATAGIGVPIAEEGNPVITNDAGLSEIFEDFQVYYYKQFVPSSADPELSKYYYVACNCNAEDLKAALDGYVTVIESASTEPAPAGYLLSTGETENLKTVVYPNPFSSELNIRTEDQISSFVIVDLSGKLLVNTISETFFKQALSDLPAASYFLKLSFADGATASYKLLKK